MTDFVRQTPENPRVVPGARGLVGHGGRGGPPSEPGRSPAGFPTGVSFQLISGVEGHVLIGFLLFPGHPGEDQRDSGRRETAHPVCRLDRKRREFNTFSEMKLYNNFAKRIINLKPLNTKLHCSKLMNVHILNYCLFNLPTFTPTILYVGYHYIFFVLFKQTLTWYYFVTELSRKSSSHEKPDFLVKPSSQYLSTFLINLLLCRLRC